jgi:PPOX class probable F420-dependent enzyme
MASDAEREAFLKSNRFCVLATLRRDGRARLSPMASAYDGGEILITTRSSRAGAITARRDPRVTVCCFNPELRRPYVSVTGKAVVVQDEALFLKLTSLIRGRELDDEELTAARKRYVDEGRVVLRITPEELFDTIR